MKRFILTLLPILMGSILLAQPAIQVTKVGAGDPILFLPGFTTPGSVWKETIEHLQGTYESHSVTYAGFAGVEPIKMPWYSSLKTGLIQYIQENNLTNVSIVGHSMGGNLAIDLAADLPNHISHILIVDAIPCMRELMMPGVPASSLQYDSPYNNQMLKMNEEAFLNMATGMASMMTNNDTKIQDIIQWSTTADRETYVYGYTDLLQLDQRELLKNISTKTLILMASFPDVNQIKANYEKQYANLESKEFLLAENSKHFIMLDQPEWFYATLNSFLKE